MKYDAFISYRHTPLDMEIAKKVHVGLETYHVPGAVQKKTGKKKIQRVFRDQEELPIGSDLNENISAALRESEYLIVICSPETPGSYWVCKEIETFIEMHDRQHILAVLVAGEPEESFPPALLCDEEGNSVEPLAADVRGATAAERKKKFKTELLRLAAPLLGCTYDDLRQRHRERILKRNILIGAVTAGILAITGTGFGIYNARVAARMKKLADEKAQLAEDKSNLANEKSNLANEKARLADEKTKLADDILKEFQEKQVNQSRFYAEEAMAQYRLGNLTDAVLIASAGLPSADLDRPYVAEAEYALASALHAYDSGSELSIDRALEHDHSVRHMSLEESGKYLATIDNGRTIYVWDMESGELLLKLAPEIGADSLRPDVVDAYADASGLVVVYGKVLVRYDYSGKEIIRQPWDEIIIGCAIDEETDTIFISSSQKLSILSLPDLQVLSQIQAEKGSEISKDCEFSKDGRWMAFGHSAEDEKSAGVTILDRKSGKTVTTPLSQEHILDMTVTDQGNVAVVSTNNNFFYAGLEKITMDVIRAADGKTLYSLDIPCSNWEYLDFKMKISAHSYDGRSDIVIASDSDAFSIDEASGETKAHIALPGSVVALALAEGTDTMFICCRNGDIIVSGSNDGKIYSMQTVSSGISSEDMRLLNGGFVLLEKNSPRVIVLKRHTAYDLQKLPDLPSSCQGMNASPSAQYYVLDGNNTGVYYFFDPAGKCIHTTDVGGYVLANGFFQDRFVMVTGREVYLIDPLSQTEKKISFKDLGIREKYSNARLTADGRYLTTYSSFVGADVIDLEQETCIHSEILDENIGTVTLSGDGKYLLLYGTGTYLNIVDITTGQKTLPADPHLRQFVNSFQIPFLSCDASGRYAAMACSDGYARILSLPSGEVLQKIPLSADLTCFLGFTKDSQHILMQGDDLRVKIYDLSSWTCKNTIEISQKVAYIVEDEGRIALCNNKDVILLDAQSFGRLADVTDAAVYLPKTGTFILVDGRTAGSTKYKPYPELLQEAERQYPGAKLSEEKKVRYNMD